MIVEILKSLAITNVRFIDNKGLYGCFKFKDIETFNIVDLYFSGNSASQSGGQFNGRGMKKSDDETILNS